MYRAASLLDFPLPARKTVALQALVLVFVVFAAIDGHCASPADKVRLSLADAVAMGLRGNADLQGEFLNSAMGEADVARNRGIYDPVLTMSATGTGTSIPGVVNGGVPGADAGMDKNANASVGVSQLLPTGGTVTAFTQSGLSVSGISTPGFPSRYWQSTAGVTITQPLLKNAGKMMTEINITLAKSALKDSLEHYRSVAADTVYSIINSYNRLYALRRTLDSKKQSLGTAQKLLDDAQAKVKAGSSPKMEITNAEYGVAQRRKDLVDAERNVRDQEANLRYLIGMHDRGEVIPIDPPSQEDPKETDAQAVQKAHELRSDLIQLRSQLKSSELMERAAKNQTLPDLAITGGGGVTGGGNTPGMNVKQMGNGNVWWSAGMQLTVPIGNTAALNDYKKSHIKCEQVRTQIDALSWKIENDVQSDLRALISARLQMQSAKKAREYAEQRLEEYRKNNKGGTASTQEVLNAETDLSTARSGEIEAAETYADAVAKLWHDTGELLDRTGVKINTTSAGTLVGGAG